MFGVMGLGGFGVKGRVGGLGFGVQDLWIVCGLFAERGAPCVREYYGCFGAFI